jgi:hypothetical protein
MTGRNTKRMFLVSVALIGLLLVYHVRAEAPFEFPGREPGNAEGRIAQGELILQNNVVACTWSTMDEHIRPTSVTDGLSGSTLQLQMAESFQLVLDKGQSVKSSDLKLVGNPELRNLEPKPKACRLAERLGGKQITATLISSDGNLKVEWYAILRDGSNYVRQEVRISPGKETIEVNEIVLLEFPLSGVRVMGTVDGSAAVAGNMFFALEHPMSKSQILQGQIPELRCSLPCRAVLRPGELLTQGCVIGVAPSGQLRRGFLYYVERERAHQYRPFLHYNSWYDIGYGGEKIQEIQCIKVIELFGKELINRRKVVMDSFVLDDGWDDNTSLWQFHKGFPSGFSQLKKIADNYDSALGAWLSPFGGYGEAKQQRIKYGLQQGFETNARGFSLSGPRYYARFRDVCANMIHEYGLNYFKFDGIGAGGIPSRTGSEYAQDVEALLQVLRELRQVKPDVFVNITTGTWPSTYWLWYGDSTWRGGSDWSTHGWGSKRQQQITYRDKETYHNVVCRSPLYPLNSLMTQGVMFANHGLPSEVDCLVEDIQDFFASGTNCQELYITPSLMRSQQWDALAEAARWSRNNTDVLVDTHWVGGDPAEGQVYGWVSWCKRKGILSLRNPSDKAGEIRVDLGKAFELPKGAAQKYYLRSPWVKDVNETELVLSAGEEHTFKLIPFEVRVFDATPF